MLAIFSAFVAHPQARRQYAKKAMQKFSELIKLCIGPQHPTQGLIFIITMQISCCHLHRHHLQANKASTGKEHLPAQKRRTVRSNLVHKKHACNTIL